MNEVSARKLAADFKIVMDDVEELIKRRPVRLASALEICVSVWKKR